VDEEAKARAGMQSQSIIIIIIIIIIINMHTDRRGHTCRQKCGAKESG
jgi:hypothetical protein